MAVVLPQVKDKWEASDLLYKNISIFLRSHKFIDNPVNNQGQSMGTTYTMSFEILVVSETNESKIITPTFL